MSAINLTPNAISYDTTGQEFGSGSLNGGYGTAAGALPASGDVTIEAWVKLTTSPGALKSAIGNQNGAWFGCDSAGKAQGNAGQGAGDVNFTTSVSLIGGWHHLALCFGASGIQFYVDGSLVGNSASSDATAGVSRNGNPFAVGNYGGNPIYQWPGEIDEVAIWNTRKYTAAFAPPTTPYTGNEAGLAHLWHLDGTGNDSVVISTTLVAPNNPAIVYSPLTWAVTSSFAKAASAAAKFSVMFSGSSPPTLNFDLSSLSSPYAQIYYSIDGYNAQAPLTRATLAATITPTMPADTAASPWHLLEVVVKATSTLSDRWTNPQVSFTGLSVPAGTALLAPGVRSKTIWVMSDSIGEGYNAIQDSASNNVDNNDALVAWPYRLGAHLGAEVAVTSYGSQGFTVPGLGNIPSLNASYNLLYAGAPRSFGNPPDLIVICQGGNDQSQGASDATTTAGVTTLLNNLLTACPATPIAMLRPFNGAKASAIQGGIAACSAPSRVTYIDTTGMLNTAYGIDKYNLHPSAANHIGIIAPQIANTLRPLLGGATAPRFASGFH